MLASPGRLVRPARQVRPVQPGRKVRKVLEENGDPRGQRVILAIPLKDEAAN